MIQFNLLPDVKKEYVKAKKTKRLIFTVSLLSSIASLIIVGIAYSYVNFGQKGHIDRLSDDISKETSSIQSTPDLNKVLTVQNQLSLLGELHTSKPETSRLFDYLTFVTPDTAKISTFSLDVQSSSMRVIGSADSIATINKLVDNIKAVEYSIVGFESELQRPYSEVATSLGGDNDGASFTIDMSFDPVIFDNTQEITMSLVGQTISTTNQGGGDAN